MVRSLTKKDMKKQIFYLLIVLLGAFGQSCKEEARIDYIDESLPAPAQVSNVEIVETPGGAIVTYKRSEEHTSELQSLMRISYAVFCLKKKKKKKQTEKTKTHI